jgi:hypothetical protein
VLRPGSQLSGIEVKLLTVPSYAVREYFSTPTALLRPRRRSTLGDTRYASEPYARTLRTETNSDGTFEFPRVADGEWRLAAEV